MKNKNIPIIVATFQKGREPLWFTQDEWERFHNYIIEENNKIILDKFWESMVKSGGITDGRKAHLEYVNKQRNKMEDAVDFYENGKYYKPEPEEICIGFECELYHSYYIPERRIEKLKIETVDDFSTDRDGYGTIADILYGFRTGTPIRVKYLDREDIEELGWENLEIRENSHRSNEFFILGTIRNYDLSYDINNSKVTISDNQEFAHNWFTGTIKNKSELKRLMKQLNIVP